MKPFSLLLAAITVVYLPTLTACSKAAVLPPLPVEVRTRNASPLTNYHKVAHFTNTSTNTLSISATFKNAAFSDEKKFNLILSPGTYAEIGWREGWDLLPGETITLEAPGFKKWTIVIPE